MVLESMEGWILTLFQLVVNYSKLFFYSVCKDWKITGHHGNPIVDHGHLYMVKEMYHYEWHGFSVISSNCLHSSNLSRGWSQMCMYSSGLEESIR